jgi:hypothetical protein
MIDNIETCSFNTELIELLSKRSAPYSWNCAGVNESHMLIGCKKRVKLYVYQVRVYFRALAATASSDYLRVLINNWTQTTLRLNTNGLSTMRQDFTSTWNIIVLRVLRSCSCINDDPLWSCRQQVSPKFKYVFTKLEVVKSKNAHAYKIVAMVVSDLKSITAICWLS